MTGTTTQQLLPSYLSTHSPNSQTTMAAIEARERSYYTGFSTPILIDTLSIGSKGKPFCLKTTIRSTLHTQQRSYTELNENLKPIVDAELKKLYVGDKFLECLLGYVDNTVNIPGNAPPPCRATKIARRVPNLNPPSDSQLQGALLSLYADMAAMSLKEAPLITTDASMHDVISNSMIGLLNLIIKVRILNLSVWLYWQTEGMQTKEGNSIMQENLPVGSDVVTDDEVGSRKERKSSWHANFADALGKPLSVIAAQEHSFFPRWTRPAIGLLPPGEKAGLPDYVLLENPGRRGNVLAIGDCGQPWIYTTADIWDIYHAGKCYITAAEPYHFQDVPQHSQGTLAVWQRIQMVSSNKDNKFDHHTESLNPDLHSNEDHEGTHGLVYQHTCSGVFLPSPRQEV